MYSPRLSPYAHSASTDYHSSQTAALESQISSLQVLLLSHIAAPPWLPSQYPHTELLRQWDFLRLKFGSEIWRALRARTGSFGAEDAEKGKPLPEVKFRRKYKATETALASCCSVLRRGIWDVFLPGLEADIDMSLRIVEKRLSLHASDISETPSTSSDEATKALKAAREWRIMTLGLLLQTEKEKEKDRKLKAKSEKPLPPTPEEKEKGLSTGSPPSLPSSNPLYTLASTITESLVGNPPASTSNGSEAGSSSPTPSLVKKLYAAVKEVADLAVSMRVQRDEEGDLVVFFPVEGEFADGSEVAEVGAVVDEDDDAEEDGDEAVGESEPANAEAEAENPQDEAAPLSRTTTGGSSGERIRAGGGVVARVVWPGLKHKERVVRKAEVMFLAAEGEGGEAES